MLSIGSETNKSSTFELVIQVRDNQGLATGRTKSFTTNNWGELQDWWQRNSYKTRKNKKKVQAAAKTDKEIAEGLKEAETHIEKIRKARKLEE